MAKMEPIRGEITVKLSQTDRELLKTLMRGLGIDPDDEKSFADVSTVMLDDETVRRLIEPQGTRMVVDQARYEDRAGKPPTPEERDRVRRLLDEREQPQAEGDWLLETERAEAGDDVD